MNSDMTEQERIEKEATEYIHNCARQFADKPSYIAGAKDEYNRFFETKTEMETVIESLKIELKQRDETIKQLKEALSELIPICADAVSLLDEYQHNWDIAQWHKTTILKARKLID